MTRFCLHVLHHPQLSMCFLKESDKAKKQLQELFEFTSGRRHPNRNALVELRAEPNLFLSPKPTFPSMQGIPSTKTPYVEKIKYMYSFQNIFPWSLYFISNIFLRQISS